jgi:hypothetical protein
MLDMLSDPIAVTYDSVAKTMPRSTGVSPAVRKVLGVNFYKTADGQFVAKTTRSLLSDGSYRTEILLTRADPIELTSNSVGLIFDTNSMGENPGDIAKLRDALDAFVTPAIALRLTGGEI